MPSMQIDIGAESFSAARPPNASWRGGVDRRGARKKVPVQTESDPACTPLRFGDDAGYRPSASAVRQTGAATRSDKRVDFLLNRRALMLRNDVSA